MTARDAPALLGLLGDCLEVRAVASASNGGVPEGDFFAADLGRIVDSPLCRLPLPIREAAKVLGAEARSTAVRHVRRRRGQYSRVDGLRSAFPEFCHVFQPAGFEGDDTWLRVALVETAIRKALPRDQRDGLRTGILDEDDRHLLGLIAYQPPEEWGPVFHKLVVQLGDVLHMRAGTLTQPPRIPDKALDQVEIPNLEPAEARRRVSEALVRAFAYIAELAIQESKEPSRPSVRPPLPTPRVPTGPGPGRNLYLDSTGTFPIPPSLQALVDVDPDAPPLADFVDPPILLRAPTPRTVLEEEGEDVDDNDEELVPINETAKAAAQEAEAAHLLFLSGSLQPEVSRVLSPPVFAAVLEYAEARAFVPGGDDARQQTVWLALMMSGLTSRHPEIVLDALRRLADGNRQVRTDEFSIDRLGFWSRLPKAEVSDRKAPPPRPPRLHFSWPSSFADRFWGIWSSRADWNSVLAIDMRPLIHEASQALRDEVYGQFSLLRLRNTLPSAVFTGSGDDCLAQLASGDTLRHSDGALHYYSNIHGRIRRQFAWALCGWLPRHWSWIVRGQNGDDAVFGLPRSRLPDSEVTAAITKLAERADQPPPPRAESKDLCEHHNRFTAYVVALFAACAAHRLTDHLKEVTRRHLVLRWAGQSYGVATFLDKLTVCALSSRAAALSPMVVVQIEIYLAHLDRLVGRLERKGRRHRHAILALQSAIRGDGPLFLHLTHDERFRGYTGVRPFTTADLSALWPQWRYPAYVLRHRFASFLWRFGLGRDDVARQMGHAVEGVAFDESDPDSVVRFVERLALSGQREQEAPLDRALLGEGWRIVRSWIPERIEVPSSAVDVPASIVADQSEVIRAHEKLQSKAVANAMGKAIIVDESARKESPEQRRSLFQKARELAHARLDEWLALTEQTQARDTRTLFRDDVERLMEFATTEMPDRRYLVPVTNVVRNRLQRMRAAESGGWKVQLPAPVSVLRVAPPVITPACARAYNYCASVLEACDRWLIEWSSGADVSPDTWLGMVVIQLSLRNGITRREILFEVLANADRVQRHPLIVDTLLVPVGLGKADTLEPVSPSLAPEDAAKERIPETTDIEAEDEPFSEYVAVQGLAAICYQRWASYMSFDTDNGCEERIKSAVDRLLACVGTPPSKTGDRHGIGTTRETTDPTALAAFLTCAQLARRLTVPGIRSAWEDGRLPARTIDQNRQIAIWRGDIQRMEDAERVMSPRVATKVGDSERTSTAEILTRLREVLTLRENERGRPRSGNALIAEVEELEREYPDLMPTARWVLRYIKARLKWVGNRGQRASLYEDYTVWRGPFLATLGESDLADLDPDALTALFVKSICKERCSDPPRALRVVKGIVRELVKDGMEPPDMAELCQSARIRRPIAAAYLVSPKEAEWVNRQLCEWVRWARASGSTAGIDAFDIESASELWGLQYATGMRTAEGVHLRHSEVFELSGEWFVCIRRIRRRGAKTDASVRVLRLRHFLSPEPLQRFVKFVLTQRQSHRLRNDPSVGIFASPAGASRIAAGGRITLHLNAAMRLILPARSGRPYAGRHARASFAVHATLPSEHQSPGWTRPDAPAIPAYLRHLPLRFQLRFISRALGHAYSTSTLTFYTHSLADMLMGDRGWGRPSRALVAAACGMNVSTLGVRLSRARISSGDTASVVGMMLDELMASRAADPAASIASLESIPPMRKIRVGTIKQMSRWVREWLAGERLSILEHRHGISAELLRRSVREIERLDHLYQTGIVDRSVALDGVDRSVLDERDPRGRRGPRLPRAQAIAEVLDEVEHATPEIWRRWIEHIRLQRRGLRRIGSTDDPVVSEVLARVLAEQPSGGKASAVLGLDGVHIQSNASSTFRQIRDLDFVVLLILAREQVRLENMRPVPR